MKKNYRFIFISFSIALSILFSFFYILGAFTWFDLKVLDFNLKYINQGIVDSNIVIIEYDDKTAENSLRPVTMQQIMQTIFQIEKYSPKVIAIDNFSVYGQPCVSDSVADLLKQCKNVCLGIGLVVPTDNKSINDSVYQFQEIKQCLYSMPPDIDIDLHRAVNLFNGAKLDLSKAISVGHLVLFNDADGSFRRIPAMIRCSDGVVFSFGIQAAFDYLNIKKDELSISGKNKFKTIFKVNEQGLVLIRFTNNPSSLRTISMIDLFPNDHNSKAGLDFNLFKDKLIFIGNSSTRTARFCSTPVDPYIPSIRMHAFVASNVLSDSFLYELPKYPSLAIMNILGILLTVFLLRISSNRKASLLFIVIPLFVIIGFFIIRHVTIFPLFTMTLYISSLYLFLMILRYFHYKDTLLDKLQRLQNEMRMKERLVTIGEMSSRVAHEIRNPLNAIQLHLSLLKRKQANNRTDEFIDVIHEESQRLNRFITSLLQFGKPLILSLKPVQITEEIDSIVKLLSPEMNMKSIKLNVKHESIYQTISADVDQLREVIINLLKNSIDAMENGGRIDICTFCLNPNFKITISDNGKGISQDILAKLFTPFFTTKKQGTGLGLAIVKKIVEAHRGKIEIQSTNGKGTTVSINFPIEI